MISKTLFSALLLGAAMIALPVATVTPAYAISDELNAYLGDEPTLFDTADQGVQAFIRRRGSASTSVSRITDRPVQNRQGKTRASPVLFGEWPGAGANIRGRQVQSTVRIGDLGARCVPVARQWYAVYVFRISMMAEISR